MEHHKCKCDQHYFERHKYDQKWSSYFELYATRYKATEYLDNSDNTRFSDGFFSGSLAPSGIYQFNQEFAFGVGLNFSYNSEEDISKSTIFGGSLIGLYSPIRELQLSTEFELLHVSRNYDEGFLNSLPDDYILKDTNYLLPALFIGAGYRTQNVTIGLRYDLLYSERNSIYARGLVPFIRVYF